MGEHPEKPPVKKGKKGKKFLEARGMDAALELANSIATLQEEKTQERVKNRPRPTPDHADSGVVKTDRKTKSSASRDKLKEKKTVIQAQRAQHKKEKVRARKNHSEADEARPRSATSRSPATASDPPARRKVSFA